MDTNSCPRAVCCDWEELMVISVLLKAKTSAWAWHVAWIKSYKRGPVHIQGALASIILRRWPAVPPPDRSKLRSKFFCGLILRNLLVGNKTEKSGHNELTYNFNNNFATNSRMRRHRSDTGLEGATFMYLRFLANTNSFPNNWENRRVPC